MIFIALVAVAVWLADLRLAIALPLVALAWVIAALIEWLAWRSAQGPAAYAEMSVMMAPASLPPPPPLVERPPSAAEAPPVVPDLTPPAPEPEAAPEPPPTPVPEPPAPEPPAPEPEPEPGWEPRPEPEPEPEPPVEAAPSPPAPESESPDQESGAEPDARPEPQQPVEPERQPRWARRMMLRAVPPPAEQAPPPAPVAAVPEDARVVSLPQRGYQPREWNLWDLERLARADSQRNPDRRDEWAFLFVHLRQFANADGQLPREFDSLVRESFGGLLEHQPSG
jgi:hypothetical protein